MEDYIRLRVKPEKKYISSTLKKNNGSFIATATLADFENLENELRTFNVQIAHTAAVLCQSTYSDSADSDMVEGYATEDLQRLGYVGVENYNYELADGSNRQQVDSPTNLAFTIAHKKLLNADGFYAANAFAILLRGTPNSCEWNGNFRFNKGDGSDGPTHAVWENNLYGLAKNVHAEFVKYCEKYSNDLIDGELKIDAQAQNRILVTGHSRGGGTAECLGFMFDNDVMQPTGTIFEPGGIIAKTAMKINDVQVYALAPTQGFYKRDFAKYFPNRDLSNYHNIYNVINTYDFVPTTPLIKWGYSHIGQEYTFNASDGNYEKMKKTLLNHFQQSLDDDACQMYDCETIQNWLHDFETAEQVDKTAIKNMNNDMFSMCKTAHDFNHIYDMEVNNGVKTENVKVSVAMYLQEFASYLAENNPAEWFGWLVKHPQNDAIAQKFHEGSRTLPYLAKTGPNVAHHWCTTYIAWLATLGKENYQVNEIR
ncbi:MAG: hypothetical protein LBT37_02940 [Lactobacillaceae bacterium]|jgi:hypothetical protein|nr:hypothetical protein [Lactobacillaceae bacterium]